MDTFHPSHELLIIYIIIHDVTSGSTKSEVSSSGYESMRDGSGTTSHVSGSDSASELMDSGRTNGGTHY